MSGNNKKVVVCRHFAQGNCSFGHKCHFLHQDPQGAGIPRGQDMQQQHKHHGQFQQSQQQQGMPQQFYQPQQYYHQMHSQQQHFQQQQQQQQHHHFQPQQFAQNQEELPDLSTLSLKGRLRASANDFVPTFDNAPVEEESKHHQAGVTPVSEPVTPSNGNQDLVCPCCNDNPQGGNCSQEECQQAGYCLLCDYEEAPQQSHHNPNDNWFDEWFPDHRNCPCCKGKIYQCSRLNEACGFNDGACICTVDPDIKFSP